MITRVKTDFALYYLALSRSKVPRNPLQPTRIHCVYGVIHAIPVGIQREWRVDRPQPRILLQESTHCRVVPAHAHLLQPARQRLVAVAPRAVPVVGRTRACYRVAKRIGDWRRRIRTRRAAGRYQVAPQVPVLVFRLTARNLLIHRAAVAVVYPLQRGVVTLPTAFRYQIPSMIAIPFPTVPCANVRRTRFRLQTFCRPSIDLTSISSAYPHNFAGCVYIIAQDFAILKGGQVNLGGFWWEIGLSSPSARTSERDALLR
jgi:hypothetical protein